MTPSTPRSRVLARFLNAVTEHPTPEARNDYLSEHPNADPANHTVKEQSDKGDSKAEESKADGPKEEEPKAEEPKGPDLKAHAKKVKRKVKKLLEPLEFNEFADAVESDQLDVKVGKGYAHPHGIEGPDRAVKLVRDQVAKAKKTLLEGLDVPTEGRKLIEKALDEHFKDADLSKHLKELDLTHVYPNASYASSEKAIPAGKYLDLYAVGDFITKNVSHAIESAPDIIAKLQPKLDEITKKSAQPKAEKQARLVRRVLARWSARS